MLMKIISAMSRLPEILVGLLLCTLAAIAPASEIPNRAEPVQYRAVIDAGTGAASVLSGGAQSYTAAADVLAAYPWPGNIRELVNVLDFACAVASGSMIEVDDLPEQVFRKILDQKNIIAGLEMQLNARKQEVDGVDYSFVNEATFLHMIEEGEFLEHAQVFGHRYGTPRRPEDLAYYPLLHDVTAWRGSHDYAEWEHYLEAIAAPHVNVRRGYTFNRNQLTMEAAIAGMDPGAHGWLVVGQALVVRQVGKILGRQPRQTDSGHQGQGDQADHQPQQRLHAASAPRRRNR